MQQLATLADYSETAIWLIEHDRRTPRAGGLVKLLKALGVTLGELHADNFPVNLRRGSKYKAAEAAR